MPMARAWPRMRRVSRERLKSLRLQLTDLDPKLLRQACFELHALKFIAEGDNALIIG
jgi:hypothetical protein